MAPTHTPQHEPNRPTIYQIRLDGHLTDRWSDWFEGLSITLEEGGETLLAGRVADQATLFAVLRKVRDSGLKLLSVTHIESEPNDAE